MASEGTAADKATTAPPPDDPSKPDSPQDLKKRSWKFAFKRAWSEFNKDKVTDLAAALTYYSVMSIFPALLALVSLLGVFGQGESTVNAILDIVKKMGQADAANTLRGPVEQMVNSSGAGIGLVIGIVGALWSASGYVGAFGRAMNKIYEVDEGRPMVKLRVTNLLITLGLLLMAVVIMLGLVLSGGVAKAVGDTIGLGEGAVTVWNIAKWPVILFLVVLMVALLYWGTPNVEQPKFKWMSVGAAVAIVVAILATVGFGFYVANFGKYNKTYGALAGVIVMLMWIWLMNTALLFGAEVDAETERSRQLQAGIKAEETLQLPPRDTKASEKAEEKRDKLVTEGRAIRHEAERTGAAEENHDENLEEHEREEHRRDERDERVQRRQDERDAAEAHRDRERGTAGAAASGAGATAYGTSGNSTDRGSARMNDNDTTSQPTDDDGRPVNPRNTDDGTAADGRGDARPQGDGSAAIDTDNPADVTRASATHEGEDDLAKAERLKRELGRD